MVGFWNREIAWYQAGLMGVALVLSGRGVIENYLRFILIVHVPPGVIDFKRTLRIQ
jgi:hypothetical protein